MPTTRSTNHLTTRRQGGNRRWQPRRKSASPQTMSPPSQGQNAGSNPAGATTVHPAVPCPRPVRSAGARRDGCPKGGGTDLAGGRFPTGRDGVTASFRADGWRSSKWTTSWGTSWHRHPSAARLMSSMRRREPPAAMTPVWPSAGCRSRASRAHYHSRRQATGRRVELSGASTNRRARSMATSPTARG